jgi:hypothetical protein
MSEFSQASRPSADRGGRSPWPDSRVEDERREGQAQSAPATFDLGAYIDEYADFDD